MEIGDRGMLLANVQNRAMVELRQESVFATILHQQMVESRALDHLQIRGCVH